MEHIIKICVDCYTKASEGKTLDRLGFTWLISDTTEEPHFNKGGLGSCDGCFTRLGGDRYTCEAFEITRELTK
jgi:hypothetical protein